MQTHSGHQRFFLKKPQGMEKCSSQKFHNISSLETSYSFFLHCRKMDLWFIWITLFLENNKVGKNPYFAEELYSILTQGTYTHTWVFSSRADYWNKEDTVRFNYLLLITDNFPAAPEACTFSSVIFIKSSHMGRLDLNNNFFKGASKFCWAWVCIPS